MDKLNITPEKISKPIQILAVSAIVLIFLSGFYLNATIKLISYTWAAITLITLGFIIVLIIFIFMFLLITKYRPQLQDDFNYLKYLEMKNKEIEQQDKVNSSIAQDIVVKAVKEEKSASTKNPIAWDKVATFFWLGNDFMWIQDMTHRLAPSAQIIKGVENAIQYIKNLGFEENSPAIQSLDNAKLLLLSVDKLSTSIQDKQYIIETQYAKVRMLVENAKWYIHAFATQFQEKDFEKLKAYTTNISTV